MKLYDFHGTQIRISAITIIGPVEKTRESSGDCLEEWRYRVWTEHHHVDSPTDLTRMLAGISRSKLIEAINHKEAQ